ncbi:CpaF family protein [Neomoorella mulderi]|uniref:Type IV secretion system protein PtlH n=1 Tax=Moorella mulderi DSM 14980 TaxID=1122241 RepID=A0A151ASW7_9FIRM|nr:ATPase, T2SS/T4P/T4SS family [Moorella mulderi]KYH30754.1 type IV secretion system protein PtlH [Moorella mulderi DSM 14980]
MDLQNQEWNEVLEATRRALVDKYGESLLSANGSMVEIVRQETRNVLGREDKEIEDFVVSWIAGLGPVDRLLKDPLVSEVMINGPRDIFVEREGRIEKTELGYRDEGEVMNLLYRLVQRCGRRINFSSPLVDARLPDGSRVNAVVPPAAPSPCITIRRFVKRTFSTAELLDMGFVSGEMVDFLQAAVEGKANIVVAGATGSGKTTVIRWLCGFIPSQERVITIEDTLELGLEREHVVPLEASDKAGIYELMINALRMRPDRIILGEVRGKEAFELLQAMGTGHDGSITSVHTNYNKKAAIQRLVRAALKAGGVTAAELEAMIVEVIDLLVFVERLRDGSRKLVSISQVVPEDGKPAFRDIYLYRYSKGVHECVGEVAGELKEKLRKNLAGCLPPIRPFGGGGCD